MQYLWKIGGEAGFGIMTTGVAFDKIATRSGYHIFDYAEYPSLIRGGHNTYDVNLSDQEVRMTKEKVDMLVCLNKETYDRHHHRLTETSVVVYDPDEFEFEQHVIKVTLPFSKLRKEFEIFQFMTNTIAVGASVALLGADINLYLDIITAEFQRKGDTVVEFNKKLAMAGYNHIQQHHADKIQPILTPKADRPAKMVMTGNEAFALATVAADVRYYASYPMTPTSAVLSILAGWADDTGMVVRHSEDEIAAINSALGSSHMGVRSAVATSGGGFALMVEALSFAGVAELPIVVFLGQRPGPATGMPTWTEQGDLLFAVHSGHGEYPKIVLAAGDIKETIHLALKAYDLADIYQTPVILMGDKLLCESHKSELHDEIMQALNSYKPNRGKLITQASSNYLRYQLSADGISERLVPGQKDVYYQSNSYSHLENGHTTEDGQHRQDQVEKLNQKTKTYFANHFTPPMLYGDVNAKTVLVSWGANKGPILEAQKLLHAKGHDVGYMHFTHMFPLDEQKIRAFFKEGVRYVLVENNSHAQFGKLLRMETGITIEEKLLKYDGRPFYAEEIVNYIHR